MFIFMYSIPVLMIPVSKTSFSNPFLDTEDYMGTNIQEIIYMGVCFNFCSQTQWFCIGAIYTTSFLRVLIMCDYMHEKKLQSTNRHTGR